MSASSHLERRGAVYYYRRRLPRRLAHRIGQRFLILSLKTREPLAARYIAAQLDAVFAKMTLESSDFWISKAQLQDFFRHAYRVHEEIVRRSHAKSLAAGWRSERPDLLNLVEGWAWRLIALQGPAACLRPEDMDAMREGNVPDDLFAEVEALLAFHCRPDRLAEQREHVAKVLVEVGAVPSDTNVDRALSAFARAKSEANFRNLPHIEELDVDALISDARVQTHGIAWTTPRTRPWGEGSDDARTSPAAPTLAMPPLEIAAPAHPIRVASRDAGPEAAPVSLTSSPSPQVGRSIQRDFSVATVAEKLRARPPRVPSRRVFRPSTRSLSRPASGGILWPADRGHCSPCTHDVRR